MLVATTTCLYCPSQEGFHILVEELLVLAWVAAACSGLLMRSQERREGTCLGKRCCALAGSPAQC